MTLCDTGPIVALLNRNDPWHRRCTLVLRTLSPPLVTTQACISEAMYLLGRDTGFPGQSALWGMLVAQRIIVAETGPDAMRHAEAFMLQYKDTPCDYADATLLALAEERAFRQILTIDRYFFAYRLDTGESLDVVPPLR